MSEEKELFLPKHLTQIERLSDIQVSKSGGRVVFVATHLHDDGDRYLSTIYRIPFDYELRERSKIRVMTQRGKRDYAPRFAPMGELTFISTRENDIPQIFLIHSDGGEAQQITDIATGVNKYEWMPDGKNIIIETSVYPNLSPEETIKKDKEDFKLKKEGIILSGYPIRYWNEYVGPKYPHLFLYNVNTKEMRDLTKDATVDYVNRRWYISFDGKKLLVAFNEIKDIAVYSNIGIIDVATGERTKITDGKNFYVFPKFSPDSEKVLCEFRPKEEGKVGKRDIVLIDVKTGNIENLTKDIDAWCHDAIFVPYSDNIIFHCDIRTTTQIQMLNLKDKKITPVIDYGHNYGTTVSPDGRNLLYIHEEVGQPGDIYIKPFEMNSKASRVTDFNKELLSKLKIQKKEIIETKGANNDTIESILIKPIDFDPNKKYPLLVILHGGPYLSFVDRFEYRFNPQPYVSSGYVVLKINSRGSIGYGQKFIEENMGKWGDLAFKDVMMTVEQVTKENSFIDSSRMAALGTSFGGYMVNWIASQKETAEKFKCYISYAGIFNLASFFGTTDLSHQYEHEFGGTPYDKTELYVKWSPSSYSSNFKRPMLLIHGAKDYRISISESLQLYSALVRAGVDVKFLFFKDESHWIMKPHNYIMYYETVLEWLNKYLKS